MRQIEVSKIYVDEQGIRSAGHEILKESFDRYKELVSLSSIDRLRMLNLEGLHLYALNQQGQLVMQPISTTALTTAAEHANVNLRVITTGQIALFKELFFDVRDRFISSGEYGLDAYLSVRIRHGVLQNQVRSPLETLHLISEKDAATGNYLDNPYWDGRLTELSEDTIKAIRKQLALFSRKVDDVALKLNKTMVQVKTERKNPEALFDYTFSDAYLLELASSDFATATDFETFFDNIFQILWKRTQENLEKIRSTISGTIKNEIYGVLSELEKQVRQLVESHQAPELLRNIVSCQTNLQYELARIAQWFTISRSSLISEFSIDELLNVCVQSINNIYPHKKIIPDIVYVGNVILDGKHFAHFSDIVRTLLDNIIVHSGLPADQMGVEVDATILGTTMALDIKNNIANSVRELDPVAQLNSAHEKMNSSDIGEVIAREGGSGLLKVRKIMEVDLQRPNPFLHFYYSTEAKFAVTLRMDLEGLIHEGTSDRG